MRGEGVFHLKTVILLSFFLVGQLVLPAKAETRTERPDLISMFEQKGVVGTFVLYDLKKDHFTIINPQRAAQRFIPASTFKLANSLIALETKVVADELEIIPYGGEPQLFKSWEKDMSMREAIKISNVPVFQELASRIGIKRYKKWLLVLDYGNHQISDDVDNFWLDGPLKISAIEQVNFLSKLASKSLPLSHGSQLTVAKISQLSKTRTGSLHGKTGWSSATTPQIGWFVGWINGENGVVSFALNIDIQSKIDARKRKLIAFSILKKLGVL